jgi:fermentation-respiration switch protein FrsA (DUF1100 family)
MGVFMFQNLPALFTFWVAVSLPTITNAQTVTDPYAVLREAYGKGDADLATMAYTQDATYAEIYAQAVPVVRGGHAEIRAGFVRLFQQLGVSPTSPADLNFRFVTRRTYGPLGRHTGFYRLIVGKGRARKAHFGQFATTLREGRFQFDVSGEATESDFETPAGHVLFNPDDEELSAPYYEGLTGVFTGQSGCSQIVTRSVLRLFLFDECTGSWRRLSRVSGREWTAGAKVIDPTVASRISFFGRDIPAPKFKQAAETFDRANPFKREIVTFGANPKLAGTLYIPTGMSGKRPAIVLIHGSGPQDRNGYASYIALLAHHLAKAGMVVLTYDKRGTGLSEGDHASAGFDKLAADASAGLAYLRTRAEVDAARVGFGGSSQAGWVAATAIRDGADPAFTMLIGAAGSALTVEEQNLYNTRVRMECAGIAPSDVKLALDQQRAFFAARRSNQATPNLVKISSAAIAVPAIRDWLFPDRVNRTGPPEWYDVLDPDFDPLPVWKKYSGKAFFLFGSLDDSTPTYVAAKRLGLRKGQTVTVLKGAQHIGLQASNLCRADISDGARFHPGLFSALTTWAKSL